MISLPQWCQFSETGANDHGLWSSIEETRGRVYSTLQTTGFCSSFTPAGLFTPKFDGRKMEVPQEHLLWNYVPQNKHLRIYFIKTSIKKNVAWFYCFKFAYYDFRLDKSLLFYLGKLIDFNLIPLNDIGQPKCWVWRRIRTRC